MSLLIETNKLKILMDMGQSDAFYRNAISLGIDLSLVDIAFISHGHYDHGGGLETFFNINEKAPVYVNMYAFEPHFNGKDKYIGLDEKLKDSKRIHFLTNDTKISENITIFTGHQRKSNHVFDNFGQQMLLDGKMFPEDFRHEQYLEIQENSKTFIFSGCSHRGIENILNWFRPDVFVGGFHFTKIKPGPELKAYGTRLNKYLTHYYTCHCTGTEQFDFLKQYIQKLDYISCGKTIII